MRNGTCYGGHGSQGSMRMARKRCAREYGLSDGYACTERLDEHQSFLAMGQGLSKDHLQEFTHP